MGGFAASGVVLGAAYMLWLYQRTMFGKIENPTNEKLLDLTRPRALTFAPLLILAVWIGLYPKPIFDVLRRPSEKIVQAVGGPIAEAPALALKAPATEAPRP